MKRAAVPPVPAPRFLEVEWLDILPESDACARRSRRDLRRVNTLMGNGRILARALHRLYPAAPPRCIVDLGAGDGGLAAELARRLSPRWPGVQVVLVDRQCAADPATLESIRARGWTVQQSAQDLLSPAFRLPPGTDLCIANLVLHHFTEEQLRVLFQRIAGNATGLVAVEPRRSTLGMAGSRALGMIGCNAVTRHDAVASVRAGFAGRELSGLWPADPGWQISERAAGLFSHLFVAHRAGS